ncbi:hypothetical protein [Gymnodinialimonas sp.]
MRDDLRARLKAAIGAQHFVDMRLLEEVNSDGLDVVWIDMVHKGFADGPELETMARVVDEAWIVLAEENVTPIVSFISSEEDQPLAAAE